MYNYKKLDESQTGSHFFVKTPKDIVLRVSLYKPSEDYISEYLENNVRHLLIAKANDLTLGFEEAKESCETIAHIVYEFLAYNECVVKIEVNKNCGKNFRIVKMLDSRPDDVKGFIKETEDDCTIYYVYNRLKVEGTDLLSELIKEYDS